MAEKEEKKKDESGILVVLFFIALVLISPGAMVFCTVADMVSYKFAAGQAWIFSLLVSAAIFGGFYAKNRSFREGGIQYLILCAVISGIYLVSSFGFHASFPKRHISYLLPIAKPANPSLQAEANDASAQ